MQPAMTPAIEQATATVMVPLPPASRASTILAKFSWLSLFIRPTAIAATMDSAAAFCMEAVLKLTRTMSSTMGSSRYIFETSCLPGTISLREMPFRPSFFASRWTAMKMPAKYRKAGRMALTAMVLYGRFTYSAMRKAAAPMMGGMIWPPVDAAASTAPANSGL